MHYSKKLLTLTVLLMILSAQVQSTPTDAFHAWLNNPSHRELRYQSLIVIGLGLSLCGFYACYKGINTLASSHDTAKVISGMREFFDFCKGSLVTALGGTITITGALLICFSKHIIATLDTEIEKSQIKASQET